MSFRNSKSNKRRWYERRIVGTETELLNITQ